MFWKICGLDFFFLAEYFFLQPRKKSPNHIFFRNIGLLRQTKKFTQPKRIYSANGNPFIPMIYRFYAPPSPIFDKDFKLHVLIIVYRTWNAITFTKINLSLKAYIKFRRFFKTYGGTTDIDLKMDGTKLLSRPNKVLQREDV